MHPLFDQTVTLYRLAEGQVQRTVIPGCYYFWHDEEETAVTGIRRDRKFLLMVPGEQQTPQPGDRVFAGMGPEVTVDQWPTFLPVNVATLGQVAYAKPIFFGGRLCHTEAGRK